MRKSKRKPTQKNRKTKAQKAAPVANEPNRRDMMKLVRNGAIGAVVLGGAGWFGLSAVRATAAEMDLTRIGQGKPTVVQVHDPQCTLCTQLQREVRAALDDLGDSDLVYLVANIRGAEGQQFAAQHRVPHVTLVLFDGAGQKLQVLNGVRSAEELKPILQSLVES